MGSARSCAGGRCCGGSAGGVDAPLIGDTWPVCASGGGPLVSGGGGAPCVGADDVRFGTCSTLGDGGGVTRCIGGTWVNNGGGYDGTDSGVLLAVVPSCGCGRSTCG